MLEKRHNLAARNPRNCTFAYYRGRWRGKSCRHDHESNSDHQRQRTVHRRLRRSENWKTIYALQCKAWQWVFFLWRNHFLRAFEFLMLKPTRPLLAYVTDIFLILLERAREFLLQFVPLLLQHLLLLKTRGKFTLVGKDIERNTKVT